MADFKDCVATAFARLPETVRAAATYVYLGQLVGCSAVALNFPKHSGEKCGETGEYSAGGKYKQLSEQVRVGLPVETLDWTFATLGQPDGGRLLLHVRQVVMSRDTTSITHSPGLI